MRLDLVVHELAPFRQSFIRALAHHHPHLTMRVLLTLPDAGFAWARVIPPSVQIIELGQGHSRLSQGRPRSWWREYRKGRQLVRLLSSSPPDVLFVGGYSDVAHRMALRWAHADGINTLCWIDSNIRCDRATGVKFALKKALVQPLLGRCSAVLVCGTLGRQYAMRYGVPADRVALCPAEPDYDVIAQAAPADDREFIAPRHRFIFVGRLAEEKRVDLLLEAFALMHGKRDDWDLVIAGDGPLRTALQRSVPVALRSRIVWLGAVDDPAALARIYRACDVFVLPSSYEPWGVVVLEAAAAGLALICADGVGAAEELVKDASNGFLLRDATPESLANLLCAATADSARLNSFKAESAAVLQSWRARQPGSPLARFVGPVG